jgi:hypothetical protein
LRADHVISASSTYSMALGGVAVPVEPSEIDATPKMMRPPGHFSLMRFFFDELGRRDQREVAGKILVEAKPPVDDDVVYLHAAVERRASGRLSRGSVPQAVRTRLSAARDQRTCVAADLVDHRSLGSRGS